MNRRVNSSGHEVNAFGSVFLYRVDVDDIGRMVSWGDVYIAYIASELRPLRDDESDATPNAIAEWKDSPWQPQRTKA